MKSVVLLACCLLGMSGVGMAAEPAPAPASTAELITPSDLLARIEKQEPDLVVLDVRTAAEYAAGHVPGAVNIPHDQLPAKLAGLSKDKELVLYCRSGRRTALAEQTLRTAGFSKLLHLQGDYLVWEAQQQPLNVSPVEVATAK